MFPQCHHHTAAFKASSEKGPLRKREGAEHGLLLLGAPQQSRCSMRGLPHLLPAGSVRTAVQGGLRRRRPVGVGICESPGCHTGSLSVPPFPPPSLVLLVMHW